jgi:hypothetical protein
MWKAAATHQSTHLVCQGCAAACCDHHRRQQCDWSRAPHGSRVWVVGGFVRGFGVRVIVKTEMERCPVTQLSWNDPSSHSKLTLFTLLTLSFVLLRPFFADRETAFNLETYL